MSERRLRDIWQSQLEGETHVAIGVFDGVHIGHQQLIAGLVESARRAMREAVVVTFFPHPDKVLGAADERHYLTKPETRADLLLSAGADRVITQVFDEELRMTPAETFVAALASRLNMKELWVGVDFALGFQREGDIDFLRAQGTALGFEARTVDLVALGEGSVLARSSAIRDFLRAGRMDEARAMLGRSYALEGRVVAGDRRGRTIGAPTANLEVWSQQMIPARGVYAAWARLGDETFMAAVNIGHRPTFDGETLSIEAHLLDFDREIYGERLELRFEARLRAERKFEGLEALVAQIKADIRAARACLQGAAPSYFRLRRGGT